MNDDDDNFNDVPDLDERAVTDENDLVEIRLPQDCIPLNPTAQWWSISWTEPDPLNPSLAVWLALDKSLPAPPPGSLVNGAHQPWPPPASVWLEALSASAASTVAGSAPNELDITFSVSDNGLGAQASNTIKATTSPLVKIKLRVVMFVEPGANLNTPLQPTGGTLLSKNEVNDVVTRAVVDLMTNKFGNIGIQQTWNGTTVKLQSPCLDIGPVGAMCGDIGTEENNPRLLSPEWYVDNVVGQDGQSGAALIGPCQELNPGICCDGDESHPQCPNGGLCCLGIDTNTCAYNAYFIGHVVVGNEIFDPTLMTLGYTASPDPVLGNGWSLITDAAGRNLFDSPDPARQVKYNTLLHEFLCHWLDDHAGHTMPPCDRNDPLCPITKFCERRDLCYDGATDQFCTDQGLPPTRVNAVRILNGRARLHNCGGNP